MFKFWQVSDSDFRDYREFFIGDPFQMEANDLIRAADLAAESGDYITAAGTYEQVLRGDRTSVAAATGLGIVLQKMGRLPQALAYLTRVVAHGCDDTNVFRSLGTCYLGVGDLEHAIKAFTREAETNPTSARPLVRVAHAMAAVGLTEQAEMALVRAINLEPDLAPAHDMLAGVLQKTGHLSDARRHALVASNLDSGNPMYLGRLMYGAPVTQDDQELVERLINLCNSPSLGVREKIYSNFALGKALEDLGRFEDAAKRYANANSIALQESRRIGQVFEPETYRQEVDFIIQGFPTRQSFEKCVEGSNSELPVFIVGMMRSGTTLVEQILSSHSKVGGAGEVSFWIEAGPGLHEAQTRSHPDTSLILSEAKRYLDLLSKSCEGKRRVCDKLPQNYMNLGSIHATLPKARIIHCQRDPRDVCLSLFTTPFGKPPSFAYSAENIASAYRQYLRLLDHWRSVLPSDRFLDVEYERLVGSPEQVAREMVEFLGLDWDEACLHPERNRRVVDTPSNWQVRQPIYGSSVGRWRKFALSLSSQIEAWTIG